MPELKKPTTYLEQQALYPDASKWNSEILAHLCAIFDEYREDIDLKQMGFPKDWENQIKK